jgi:uncharacterized protein YecE (DUF72 family)
MRDRRVKFKELAEKRVNSAIRYIRLVGNLSDRGNYDYSPEDIRKIKSTLELELKNALLRFEADARKEEPNFRLNE